MRIDLYRVIHLPRKWFIRFEGGASIYLVDKKKLPTTEDVVGIWKGRELQSNENKADTAGGL